jgi:hypothetical protein
MRIGAFELSEPVPELREPRLIAALTPWIDAGKVGSLALTALENHLDTTEIGHLAEPGKFFDFTRYRPTVHYEDGERFTTVPNVPIQHGVAADGTDFLLARILEPHTFAEEYVDSLVEICKFFGVRQYCRVGGMYDVVPHTRPLLVNGSLNGESLEGKHGIDRGRRRPYEGPTSIMNIASDKMSDSNIDHIMLMVRLPHYVQLEEDHAGTSRLLGVLSSLYQFPDDLGDSRRGERQYTRITSQVEDNEEVKMLVQRLEEEYDSRRARRANRSDSPVRSESDSDDTVPPLPPSVEQLLKELGEKES